MKLLSSTLLLLIWSNLNAQVTNYQNLLDSVFGKRSATFVHSKPLKIRRLSKKDLVMYFESVQEFSNQKLDTLMFSQIIENVVTSDTSQWTDQELPTCILVHDRKETVSIKYALKKFKQESEKQLKIYKKRIRKFNFENPVDRDLLYVSRPVFDNSKTFAIVQWDNGHSYLGGGGAIVLYRLQDDNNWIEFGTILHWVY